MIDTELQLTIQKEVQKAFIKRDQENARNVFFDKNTGLHTQGKNLTGLTGDRVAHNNIRTNLTEQTITSGVINFTSSDIAVFTESSAATDDLDTINPFTLAQGNDLLILRAGDDADTVVVKNGTGNIVCFGDFPMDTINHRMLLQWDRVNENWVEITRFDAGDVDWTSWTPTLSASGAMTWTGTTIEEAIYKKEGKTVYFQVRISGTTGGVAATQLRFTLPVTPFNTTTGEVGGGCRVGDGGSYAGSWVYDNAGYVRVHRYDDANYGLGANRVVIVQGFYRID